MKRTTILRGACMAVAAMCVSTAAALVVRRVPFEPTPADASPTSPIPSTVPSTTSSSTTSTSTTTTTTIAPKPAPAPEPEPEAPAPVETLRRGDTGPAVVELQRRLVALGYWLGEADGTFGYMAEQAVTAFQKVAGLAPDGVAGPGTQAALAEAERPAAGGQSGDRVEVDKARQVMFVVRGGTVRWILNVSTGTEEPYVIDGRTELADTPLGHWKVGWAVDGVDVGLLGGLYRPRYFHRDGIAVHGYHTVPPYAASHGCVRVSEPAMDWIWANNLMPVGSDVWVY